MHSNVTGCGVAHGCQPGGCCWWSLRSAPSSFPVENIFLRTFQTFVLAALAQGELALGREGLVDVSPLPCMRCFHGGWRCPQGAHRHRGAILWVARHDSQAEESFCSADCPLSISADTHFHIALLCVSHTRRALGVHTYVELTHTAHRGC